MRLSFSKITGFLREAWVIVGLTLFLLLSIEHGLRLCLSAEWLWRLAPVTAIDYRANADTYRDRSWVGAYYGEFRKSNFTRWVPFVYWRRKPYSGQYIEIDSAGIRRTPGASQPNRNHIVKKIWMFGGSTLWGTGARDAFTIPALLQKKLNERKILCEVKNFGESGYVSTQELILLLRQIQKGDVPDAVIFYDGVNEVFSSYQQRIAGIPQNENNRIEEFNRTAIAGDGIFEIEIAKGVSAHSAIVRALRGVGRRILKKPGEGWSELKLADMPPDNDDNSLAQKTVDFYIRNTEIVKALATQYKFRALFYWQPTVLQKKNLTAYEKTLLDEQSNAEKDLLMKTYALMRLNPKVHRGERASISYLGDIFSNVSEPLYVDWCHLGEKGNQLVADRILPDVLALLIGGKS